MPSIVAAVFFESSGAIQAIDRLHDAGFDSAQITVATSVFVHNRPSPLPDEPRADIGLSVRNSIPSPGRRSRPAATDLVVMSPASDTTTGLINSLIGVGVPEREAQFFHGVLLQGGVLIGAHATGTSRAIAKSVFKECGAAALSRA